MDPLYPRRETTGIVITVLRSSRDDRHLRLMDVRTRCVRRHEVHEFIVTDEENLHPGGEIDRIGYLAFVEFDVSGVLAIGDVVDIGGILIGHLAGFDETHAPNHMNIVVHGKNRIPGLQRGLQCGQAVVIRPSGSR